MLCKPTGYAYEARQLVYRALSLTALVSLSPLLCVLYVWVKIDSKGPFIYKQTRLGRRKKRFTIYKIRTMQRGADAKLSQLSRLNEADGPVFKIRNDPRFTRAGAFLSHTGLDELPQLFNILKGEMSFVGPRPLPVAQGRLISARYAKRFCVLPGMTSTWIIKGAHSLSFKKWMELDVSYSLSPRLSDDIHIMWITFLLIVRTLMREIIRRRMHRTT